MREKRKKDYNICPKELEVCFNCYHYDPDTDEKLKDDDFNNDGFCIRYPESLMKNHRATCGEFKEDE